MACANCTTGNKLPNGCKNHGSCGTGGCNKLGVFDWLAHLSLPQDSEEEFHFVEVQFKNSRKSFFANPNYVRLQMGEMIVVEAESGYDIGMVTLRGPLVKIQMNKKKAILDVDSLPKVIRKASEKDLKILNSFRDKEADIQKKAREKATLYQLKMKISDVEFQGDGSRAIFYYTAEHRVDFRQLVKDMAFSFRTRIEMKQIGLRQEASRLGGIGSCGRELCCSSWLTHYEKVNISAAKYQDLSLNSQKLSGQCGKLKCCLNYELDTYTDTLKRFPKRNTIIYTKKGKAFCQKMDIFKEILWYSYYDQPENWIALSLETVQDIILSNKTKKDVESLESFSQKNPKEYEKIGFKDVIEDNSLSRFDRKPSPKKKKRRPKPRNNAHKP